VLTHNLRTPLLAVTDGLSNTLMLGESGARNQGWAIGAKYADTLSGIRGAWASESNNITCSGTQGPLTAGVAPVGKLSSSTQVATAARAINAWNQGELYSFHPGVCNVVMGDGSVRALSDSISLGAMYKLAARADGLVNDPE
jgi:prepilin-type processing-associated H-X9-DG protein